ncbi:MAG: hypothetical protein KDK08_06060, partial [Rhizobiaceae bacterium]|nr:hypothetical protein [Rhizobiaceae bacterium]
STPLRAAKHPAIFKTCDPVRVLSCVIRGLRVKLNPGDGRPAAETWQIGDASLIVEFVFPVWE